MGIISNIQNTVNDVTKSVTDQISRIAKQIKQLNNAIVMIIDIKSVTNQYHDDSNNNSKIIKVNCNQIYKSQGSNISKSVIEYIDSLDVVSIRKNRDITNKIFDTADSSITKAKKKINELNNKAKQINNCGSR